jgi:selenide,water dikinase
VLQQLLAGQPQTAAYAQLLVGRETGDDAAVWRIDDEHCIISTTDFFMPMVDDPYDFGRIAAANALSDVYAMGGKPIMALAILGMPLGKLPVDTARAILEGGASICAEAGVPVAGGHSIDAPEPIYGLAVTGLCKVSDIRRNSGARVGDALILTKDLGVGIYSAAFKKNALSEVAYAELMATTTLLNRVGATLGGDADVHAITDVTGFGLLGHALEMARGASAGLEIAYESLPFLADAQALAEAGFVTGASERNWRSYGEDVTLSARLPAIARTLLTDPQTSGGLLIACRAQRAEGIRSEIEAAGFARARVIGTVVAGEARVRIV